MRAVTNDDLWSVIRGLEMSSMSNDELREMRQRHVGIQLFASRVIAEAARQVLEIRAMRGVATFKRSVQ